MKNTFCQGKNEFLHIEIGIVKAKETDESALGAIHRPLQGLGDYVESHDWLSYIFWIGWTIVLFGLSFMVGGECA